MTDNIDVWLWLTLVMKPFNPRLAEILADCGYNAAKAGVYIRDGRISFLTEGEKSAAKSVRIGYVHGFENFCQKSGITVITYDSEDYPRLLKKIENPPPVLFALGNAKGLNEAPVLTVVGTRKISDYGLAVNDYLSKPAAASGVILASGTAQGADSAVHNACIEAGGRSLAFPGCGVLENHPAGCAELKRRVIENGGAVISELLPDTKAAMWYFRRRDAVLAGICGAALVLEAGEKSGSLITAECVKKLGRPLFAVPPRDIRESDFAGNIALIRSGAVPAFDCSDIACALGVKIKDYRKAASGEAVVPQKAAKRSAKEPKPAPKENTVQTKAVSEERLSGLSPEETLVVKAVSEKPCSAEMVIGETGLGFDAVLEMLMELEINGIIELCPDGFYRINSAN